MRSVELDLRGLLLDEIRAALLAAFPAVLGGLDEDVRGALADRALEAALAAGASMREVADAATALFTLDPEPLPERPVGSPLDGSGAELAVTAAAGVTVLLHLGGDHAVWAAAREAAGAHGLDPYVVPLDELLSLNDMRACYEAGVDRAAGRVGGRR